VALLGLEIQECALHIAKATIEREGGTEDAAGGAARARGSQHPSHSDAALLQEYDARGLNARTREALRQLRRARTDAARIYRTAKRAPHASESAHDDAAPSPELIASARTLLDRVDATIAELVAHAERMQDVCAAAAARVQPRSFVASSSSSSSSSSSASRRSSSGYSSSSSAQSATRNLLAGFEDAGREQQQQQQQQSLSHVQGDSSAGHRRAARRSKRTQARRTDQVVADRSRERASPFAQQLPRIPPRSSPSAPIGGMTSAAHLTADPPRLPPIAKASTGRQWLRAIELEVGARMP
jgi:hypothetical protein